MADAYHTKDLLKKALQFAGEVTDGNSTYHELALSFLNTAYLSVLLGSNEFDLDFGEPWAWARNTTPKSFTLQPAFDTGTVSLTNGSASGTFSSAPSISMARSFLKVDDRAAFYQILTHTAAATAFTLDTAYIQATGAALGFIALPMQYDLGASILRLVAPLRIYAARDAVAEGEDDGKIYGLELNRFDQDYPRQRIVQGIPTRFTTRQENEDTWIIEVNRYVTEKTKVDYDSVDVPTPLSDSDASIPILPRADRIVLSYMAAYWICADKGLGDKSTQYMGAAKAKLKAMVKAARRSTTHTGKNKASLLARQDQLWTARRFFTSSSNP